MKFEVPCPDFGEKKFKPQLDVSSRFKYTGCFLNSSGFWLTPVSRLLNVIMTGFLVEYSV